MLLETALILMTLIHQVDPHFVPEDDSVADIKVPLVSKDPLPAMRVPEYRRIPASELKLDLFKPEHALRPLPDFLIPVFQPAVQSTPPASTSRERPVEMLCHLDRIYVRVLKSLFTNPEASRYLRVGTCAVNQATDKHYYVLYNLNACSGIRQENQDRVIYSNTLYYEPAEPTGLLVLELPFSVALECHYNKHHRSYQLGYYPEVFGEITFLRLGSGFSITHVDDLDHKVEKPGKVMEFKNGNFQAWINFGRIKNSMTFPNFQENGGVLPPVNKYGIGQTMYFEVKANRITAGKRIYLNKCYISSSPDLTSTPTYTLLDNYGCLVEGKQSTQSKFYPSTDEGSIKFSAAAVLFKNMMSQPATKRIMYIHCEVTLGPQTPTPSAKSCTYNLSTERWTELLGDDSVCTCCDTSCPAPETPGFPADLALD